MKLSKNLHREKGVNSLNEKRCKYRKRWRVGITVYLFSPPLAVLRDSEVIFVSI